MLFDERTMQYFQAIANERNISRAAEKLYISQPSLSRFLSRLEQRLGGELFQRQTDRLVPTALGECFLSYIQEAQRLNSRYEQRFAALLSQREQTLRIGAGSITSPFLTRGVFPKFQREYPHIHLQLVEDVHVNLVQKLDHGQVDLALLVYNGEELSQLERDNVDFIISQPRLLLAGRQHPLAMLIQDPAENSVFSPQPLREEQLENHTIITGVPGQRIWEDTRSLQRKYAIKGLQFISSQSLDTSIAMAACGMGVFTLSPFYIINSQAAQRDDLVYFMLDDPLFQWILAVRYRSKNPSEPEKRITALIRETFRMDEGAVHSWPNLGPQTN